MNDVHFNALDLNLLRVFQALFAERSATRAGALLGLSQSAISHALRRLRRALQDDLFVRGPDGLVPTPRASVLGPQIGDALKQLEAAIGAPGFDPEESDRLFTIGATAYFCAVLLPAVLQRFAAAAPRARLRVRGENLRAEELDRGRLDLIIGAFDEIPTRFTFTPLFNESGVWVIRSSHPALDRGRSFAAIAHLPQVTIAPDDSPTLGLARAGLRRPNAWRYDRAFDGVQTEGVSMLTVPDTYSALAMVRQTDMIAMLPRRLAMPAAELGGLTLIDSPQPPPPVEIGAVTRAGEQGAVAWFVSLLRDAAAALGEVPLASVPTASA